MAEFERKSAILRQFARHPVGKLNCLGVAPGPGPHLVCSLPDVFPLPSRTFLLTLLEAALTPIFRRGVRGTPRNDKRPQIRVRRGTV